MSHNIYSVELMLIIIDNYDSFTYNLYQYFCILGQDVRVIKNDEMTAEEVFRLKLDYIVISPGPGRPEDTGICSDVIRKAIDFNIPVLGVCLGHQLIAGMLGAKVLHARQVMHGITSEIHHTRELLFKDIPTTFKATRYHSLIVQEDSLPSDLQTIAWVEPDNKSECREVMGINHKIHRLSGIQFHPEAINTEYGLDILNNYLTVI